MVGGLRRQPQVRVVGDGEVDQARVAVVVTDEVDRECVRVLRAVQRGGVPRTVVVARTLDNAVKNVLRDVTTRLNLRNRSHAVAYAMREGLI